MMMINKNKGLEARTRFRGMMYPNKKVKGTKTKMVKRIKRPVMIP